MQVEHALRDLSTAFADIFLRSLEPNPFKVLVPDNIENGVRMFVEQLNRLLFDPLNPRPQVLEFGAYLFTLLFELFPSAELVFDRGDILAGLSFKRYLSVTVSYFLITFAYRVKIPHKRT